MTVEEELELLSDNIRRLKVEYEVFFSGGSKKPPADLQSRVEFTLKKYSDTQKLGSHQRFLYNTLASKFSVFSDLWRKRLRAREEGLDRRGRAAAGPAPTPPLSPEISPSVLYQETLAEPQGEIEKIRSLYLALKECKESHHDDSKLPPPEAFEKFVSQKMKQLMDREKCERVTFMVVLEEQRVKFQAVPVSHHEIPPASPKGS